jgi:hypothetical protein
MKGHMAAGKGAKRTGIESGASTMGGSDDVIGSGDVNLQPLHSTEVHRDKPNAQTSDAAPFLGPGSRRAGGYAAGA